MSTSTRPDGRAAGTGGRRWQARDQGRQAGPIRSGKPIEFAEDVCGADPPESRVRCPKPRYAAGRPACGSRRPRRPAGVAHRVGNQVEQDPLEQDEVAAHPGAAGHDPQRQSLFARGFGEGGFDSRRAVARSGNSVRLGREHAGIELGNIQQGVEQLVHGGECGIDARDDPAAFAHWLCARNCATNSPSACSGCRKSWLAAAKKRDLARLASSSWCVRSSTLRSSVAYDSCSWAAIC